MKRDQLLDHLAKQVEHFIQLATDRYIVLDEFILNQKHDPRSWSLLECFEHLNRYSQYYNPILRRVIEASPIMDVNPALKSTWLGRKFIKMLHPDNLKKTKTLSRMDPVNSILSSSVIHDFVRHQIFLRDIIKLAADRNINIGSVPVEFFKILKLLPAEALEFVVVHQQRHFLQLERTLQLNSRKSFVKV